MVGGGCWVVCVGGQTDGGIVGFVAGQAWRRGRCSSSRNSGSRWGRGGERARKNKTKSQKRTRTEHTPMCDRSGDDLSGASRPLFAYDEPHL